MEWQYWLIIQFEIVNHEFSVGVNGASNRQDAEASGGGLGRNIGRWLSLWSDQGPEDQRWNAD